MREHIDLCQQGADAAAHALPLEVRDGLVDVARVARAQARREQQHLAAHEARHRLERLPRQLEHVLERCVALAVAQPLERLQVLARVARRLRQHLRLALLRDQQRERRDRVLLEELRDELGAHALHDGQARGLHIEVGVEHVVRAVQHQKERSQHAALDVLLHLGPLRTPRAVHARSERAIGCHSDLLPRALEILLPGVLTRVLGRLIRLMHRRSASAVVC